MLTEFFTRTGLQIVAAMFGGGGIFHLWMSFSDNPASSVYAILFLSFATAITFALQKQAPGRS